MGSIDGAARRVWDPGSLDGPWGIAEAIAARDLNNLYRTSRYFADPQRYQAFCALYAIMRIVDDRVDGVLTRGNVSDEEWVHEVRVLRAWWHVIATSLAGLQPPAGEVARTDHPAVDALLTAFGTAAKWFPMPRPLWENFFAAMERDLQQARFKSYGEFVDYAEGAAVAPATIYLYLLTAECREDGHYRPLPEFALIPCGRALGLFAYVAHILRDLPQDLERGLLYLAADDMAAHGVTEELLRGDLAVRRASRPVRALARELVKRAGSLATRGRDYLENLKGKVSADRAFILELIVRIYETVLQKIVACSYDLMAGRHKLTDAEKERVAVEVALRVSSRAGRPSLVPVPATARRAHADRRSRLDRDARL